MNDNQVIKMGMQKPPHRPGTGMHRLRCFRPSGAGLKLEPGEIPMNVIVVDGASRPTPNYR
jgi:hypothetical protein